MAHPLMMHGMMPMSTLTGRGPPYTGVALGTAAAARPMPTWVCHIVP